MTGEARVTVFRDPDQHRPWIVLWSSDYHLCRFAVRTQEEAAHIGRQISLSGVAPEPNAIYEARAPFPLLLEEDLRRVLDHADLLLEQALAARGAKQRKT